METKKRMQRFLSIFLACIMLLNVPMSALAYEDVMILDAVENQEVYAEQEEDISGETGIADGIVDAEVIEESNSAESIPAEGMIPETSETNDVEDLLVDEQSADGFAVEGIEVMSAEPQLEEAEESNAEPQLEEAAETTEVITLDQTTLTVAAGASETLKATVTLPSTEEGSESTEAPTVTWNSSDETVATVDNGTVTGVKIDGKATITASVTDANGTTYTASCAVEVVDGTEVVAEGTWSSSDDIRWKLTKDGTMTFCGTGVMRNSSNMSDSRTYKNYLALIKKLVVEDGITSIGQYNFVNCNNLKSITLASSVTTIGYGAFQSCKGLESVNIPETVTSVGKYVFEGCTALKSATYNSAVVPASAFGNCSNLETITFGPKVTTLQQAFKNAGLKEIVLPETITSVSSGEFNGCKQLVKATLYGSAVADRMFNNCTALKEVVLGENTNRVTGVTFKNCTSLEKLTVDPKNIKNNIKDDIIYSLDGTTLEYCVKGKSGEVIIPDGVTAIASSAFEGCTTITKVQIPEGVTAIESKTFSGCTSLTTVILPSTVTNLASNAFTGCTALKNVTVDGENTNTNFDIENGIAYSKTDNTILFIQGDCKGEVTIREGVKEIPASAFEKCTKITKVNIPASVTTIGSSAFAGCTYLEEIVIPDSVTSIGSSLFSGCTSLKTVTLSSKLKEIPMHTFSGCSSIVNMQIPEGVTSIGMYAFMDCTSLEEISLPSTLKELVYYSETVMEGYQFANCVSLKRLVIPYGVKKIPGYFLKNCLSLEYLVIPESLTMFEANALASMSRNTVVYYKAGPLAWSQITGIQYIEFTPEKWYYEVPREDGIITTQPVGATYQTGDATEPLSVSTKEPEAGMQYQFRWQSNTSRNTETGTYYIPTTVSSDGRTSTITPKNSVIGTNYYYCVVEKKDAQGKIVAVEFSDLAEVFIKDDTFAGGGTEANPFKISSAEDLTRLSELSKQQTFRGIYFQLTKDIELDETWVPIGSNYMFGGIFDGNGKTVRYAKGSDPLFAHVNGAVIKNLKIYGEEINGHGLVNNLKGVGFSGEAVCIDNVTLLSGSSTLESGLIGTKLTSNMYAGCSAAFYVTIKNCTIEKGVTIGYKKNRSLVGSIAGRMHGTIENCVSYADVYGVDHVGGILGMRDNAMGNCTITNCTFGGTVNASGIYAGGIVGGGYDNSSAPNGGIANINECTVTGSITGKNKVGGIVGGDPFVAQLWSAHTLKYNSFTGKVKATDGDHVGGIIGFYKSLNKYDDIAGNYYAADCGAQRGIGCVDIVDTNCATHENVVGRTYINTEETTASCPVVDGCWWKAQCNRTDDPLGADAEKLATTKKSTAAYVKELKISGNYKTEYYMGQEFDLTGMNFIAKWSDRTETYPTASDVKVEGFDSSKPGTQIVTISYQNASAEIEITVKKSMRVSFTLFGDSEHDSDKDGKVHTLQMNNLETWVPKTVYYYTDLNTTVYDVIKDAAKQYGFTIGARNTQHGLYIESITWKGQELAEFTNGKKSGWMCTVNEIHPNVNLAAVYVADGDEIIFHYTDDYTQEESLLYDKQMAEEITETITALPSADKLSVSDKAAVQAAREAYEALSATQKEHVSAETLKQLEAAEARIAELEKNAHVHSWDAGTVTKAPTCTATGVKTYKCGCGESKTETIPALGHKFGAWTTVSEATVKAAEVQKHTCSVCGASETQNVGSKLTPVLQIPGKLSSFNMKKGKSASFKVTMANGDSVTSVKSSKTKVLKATLDQKTGKITLKALKTGTAKLTINLDSKTSKTYTVKVVTGTVKTTGVSVTSAANKKLTLEKGKTHTLKTEVKPFTTTQKLTYKSSNKKVATVTSKGKIKAVAPGKATITVKSGSKSVKITVTVPGITNVKSSVTVKKNKTTTLKPNAYGISGKVTYTSSNPKVATVTSKGKVKGIKKGTAKITIQAGTFKKTVTVKVK